MKPLDAERVRAALGAPVQPVLVVGADGMLGRAFRELLGRLGIEHAAVNRAGLDITDEGAVEREIAKGWSVVINCEAWTNVDGAEQDEAAATRVNGEGVRRLFEACFDDETLLVNFGTDYVFSGRGERPYRVDDPIEPVNAYGRSKAAGERALAGVDSFLHVRTSWLYGPWGNNFVRTIARLAREKPVLRVVNDQRGRPTSAEHLARATLSLIVNRVRGIAHVTDGGQCTWYEFATEIVKLTGAACEVQPCTSAEFPRPAKRPAYSVLDISRTEELLGPMPDWRANLADVVARLE